jgi:hypothetical protein
MTKGTIIGAAFTRKGREKTALQKVVIDTGYDSGDLEYVEDPRTNTAKVIHTDGRILGRFAW